MKTATLHLLTSAIVRNSPHNAEHIAAAIHHFGTIATITPANVGELAAILDIHDLAMALLDHRHFAHYRRVQEAAYANSTAYRAAIEQAFVEQLAHQQETS